MFNAISTKILTLAFFGVFFAVSFAAADIMTTINGDSNGVLLYGVSGPKKLGVMTNVSKTGGSIKEAKARGIYTKYRVDIGNEVIAKKTSGDPNMTHLRAGSLFYGIATVVANKKGATIKNFIINYKINGSLKCKADDPLVTKFHSRAYAETLVQFDNKTKFQGSAEQDGAGIFDGGKKKLASKFQQIDRYQASINKTFPIKLGTVRDGQKFHVLFLGDTVVSFAAETPIAYCAADFLKTSTFTEKAGQGAKMGYRQAKKVKIAFDPTPFPLSQFFGDFKVYVEGPESLLKKIELETVKLYVRIGDNGAIKPVSMDEIGDQDQDGKKDRALVFSGQDMTSLLEMSQWGYTTKETLFMTGSADEEAFIGKGKLETKF